MKVGLIIGSFYPATFYGGPIFSVYYLSRELARRDVDVLVSTTNANGDTNLNVETNKFISFGDHFLVKYYGGANRKSFSWMLICNIWKDIKNADVLFLQPLFSSYVPVSLFYAALFQKPVLLSPRGSLGAWCLEKKRSTLKRLWLVFFLLPFRKRIWWHATSEQEKQEIIAVHRGARVWIIPNGVDVAAEQPPDVLSSHEYTTRFIGRPIASSHKIISMGRLHEKKGFDILINAFSIVQRDYPDALLLIAGPDAGALQQLRQMVLALSLRDTVFFVGELSGRDKTNFLANGDLFVLPSHNENFGNVYAESLAAGTPVVASTQTPWQDVEKYDCGKWVQNSPEATASAMKELLERNLGDLGRRGKQYVEESFSWESVAARFCNTFDAIINEFRRGPT